MSEKIPDFQSLMYPVLSLLGDNKPHPLQEVMNTLAEKYDLSEDDLKIKVPSGQMGVFKNRVTWAISYLKKAGLLHYPKTATYSITEAGRKVLTENISYINIAYLKQFDEYKKWQETFDKPATSKETNTSAEINPTQTPDETLGDTLKQVNERLALELLEMLKSKPFSHFERFVMRLLDGMGYGGVEERNFEVVGQSGDNGIDGIIYQDKLGIERIYVQAKRWKDSKVPSKEIRDFIGSLSLRGTNKGIFITTSDFTEDAISTSKMNPHNRIILINGLKLAELAIENNVGVYTKKRFELKDIDIDFFDEL